MTAGDVRGISERYALALKLATFLDQNPRLGLEVSDSIKKESRPCKSMLFPKSCGSRSGDALARLLTLLKGMNTIAPVWSQPADKFLDSLPEAEDPGFARTIETSRRVSAAQVQQESLPILAELQLYDEDWREAEKTLQQSLYSSFRRDAVCGSVDQLRYWKDLATADEAINKTADTENWLHEWVNCAGAANRNSAASAAAFVEYGKLLHRRSDLYGAEYLFRRAISVLSSRTFQGDLAMVSAELGLADLLVDEGRNPESSRLVLSAAKTLATTPVTTAEWKILASEALEVLAHVMPQTSETCAAAFALGQHASRPQAAIALQAFAERASLKDPRLASSVQHLFELQRQRDVVDVDFQKTFATPRAGKPHLP